MAEWLHIVFELPKSFQFLIVYALSMLGLWQMNLREFNRCPEKRMRYQSLPVVFKLGCWFIVMPLIAGTFLEGALFIPAIASFMLLEAACVRWYRKAGLLP